MTSIRYPVAENFYAGDCMRQMEVFLAGYQPPALTNPTACGALLPHAGWVYSGRTAARTLRTIADRVTPKTVIILGADHSGLAGPILFPSGRWETPLGSLAIDEDLTMALVDHFSGRVELDFHAHGGEHSIEVITPMIKYFWPQAQLVAMIVPPSTAGVELGPAMAAVVKNKNVLLIASTDLTHYGRFYGVSPAGTGANGFNWLKQNDRRIIDLLLKCQYDKIMDEVRQNHNACGSGGIVTLLAAVNSLGIDRGTLIEYTTSHGDGKPEEFTYGVGYAGIVY